MSDETATAIEDALRAHIADEVDGAYLTDWYCITASAGEDAYSTSYLHVSSSMPPHTSYGLVARALRRLNREDSSE